MGEEELVMTLLNNYISRNVLGRMRGCQRVSHGVARLCE